VLGVMAVSRLVAGTTPSHALSFGDVKLK
jgi:hypothetical protein